MKKRVLVIDDNREIRIAWVAAIEEAGYEVADAPNGRIGYHMFTQFKPDLVLVDLKMPEMGGREVCRLIREESDTPIIMLSAVSDEMEKVQAMEAGADDYVVKGVGVNELLARIAARLQWVRKRQVGEPEIPATWTADQDEIRQRREALKQSGLTILIVDPDAQERRRVRRIVERNGHNALEAPDGREALAFVEFKRPDVMITEFELPVISGQKLLLRMKKEGLTEHIAVIVASHVGTPGARAVARVTGAVDYIVKPWSAHEIEFRIGLALNTLRVMRRKHALARADEDRRRAEESAGVKGLLSGI